MTVETMSTIASKGIRSFFKGVGEFLAKDSLKNNLSSIVFVTGNESAGM